MVYKAYINLVMKVVDKLDFIHNKKKAKKFFMYFYYTVTKLVVVLIVNYLIKTFKEAFILAITFMLLRQFATGIHCNKNYQCWILTLTVFILLPLLIKYLDLNNLLYLVSYPIFIINYLLFAPNDTYKHPFTNKVKRVIYKVVAVIIVTSFYVYSINNTNYVTEAMFYSSLVTLISFHPITYIVFKQSYYNHHLIKK